MMRILASRSGSASPIWRELVSTQFFSTNIASAARNLVVSSRFNGGFITKPHGPTWGGLSIFMNSVKHNCRSFTHSPTLRSSEGLGNSSDVSSSFPSTNGFVRWYLEMIDKHPILTKSITAAAIFTAADLTSQVITFATSDVSVVSDKLEFDKLRTLRMTGYGLILSGPTLHLWFNFVSKTIPTEIREENHIGATVAPNIVIKSAGGASVDLQRPTHDIHFSARANSGAPICNNLGSVRMNSDDNQHPHEPPHLRIGGLMHKVPEIPSSNGHVPSIITGPGHWVWQPLPSSVPQTASPVDYHPAITRRENVHFVAMPPFPGVSYGTVPVGAEGPAALLRGNSVQIGPQTANGTHPDIHGGVTLSLGGPGQVAGQKH